MSTVEANLMGFTVALLVVGVLAFGLEPTLAVKLATVVMLAITGLKYSKKADREP